MSATRRNGYGAVRFAENSGSAYDFSGEYMDDNEVDLNARLEEFGLQLKVLPIESLQPVEDNPRAHDERNRKAIENSINTFGFKSAVLCDKDLNVIAGHGRIDGAIQQGLDKVPVLVATDLDEIEARALRIADNQSSDLAEWQYDVLAEQLDGLVQYGFEYDQLGFDEEALEDLTGYLAYVEDPETGSQAEAPDEFPEYDDESIETEHECPKCGYRWSGGQ